MLFQRSPQYQIASNRAFSYTTSGSQHVSIHTAIEPASRSGSPVNGHYGVVSKPF